MGRWLWVLAAITGVCQHHSPGQQWQGPVPGPLDCSSWAPMAAGIPHLVIERAGKKQLQFGTWGNTFRFKRVTHFTFVFNSQARSNLSSPSAIPTVATLLWTLQSVASFCAACSRRQLSSWVSLLQATQTGELARPPTVLSVRLVHCNCETATLARDHSQSSQANMGTHERMSKTGLGNHLCLLLQWRKADREREREGNGNTGGGSRSRADAWYIAPPGKTSCLKLVASMGSFSRLPLHWWKPCCSWACGQAWWHLTLHHQKHLKRFKRYLSQLNQGKCLVPRKQTASLGEAFLHPTPPPPVGSSREPPEVLQGLSTPVCPVSGVLCLINILSV